MKRSIVLCRPVGDGGAEGLLRRGDALARGELGVPAGHHRLGLVVERAQQLALPAVPDAGADGADVGDGEHQQQLQALRALHDVGEVADGLGVADVAAEGDLAHGQVLLDRARRPSRSRPASGRSAGTARGRCARRRSSGPRRGPWRCRAGRPPRRARAGAGWCLKIVVDSGCGSAASPRSMSESTPTVRIRCSSTV